MMRKAAVPALIALLASPALAGMVETPQCRADLTRAHRLIQDVSARDRKGKEANAARICATLKRNRTDMAAAAEILDRCLTGHERGENVGQLRASVADVDAVMARHCR